MRNRAPDGIGILIVGLLVVVGFLIMSANNSSQNRQINEWASDNQYTVLEIERCYWDHGPWWFVDDDDAIYRVRLRDPNEREKVSYFKFNLWGMDQQWKE